MLDQIKKLNELRKMQSELQKQTVTAVSNGVSLTMRGDFDIIELSLNPELDAATQSEAILAAFRDARKQLQQKLAASFSGGPPQL